MPFDLFRDASNWIHDIRFAHLGFLSHVGQLRRRDSLRHEAFPSRDAKAKDDLDPRILSGTFIILVISYEIKGFITVHHLLANMHIY